MHYCHPEDETPAPLEAGEAEVEERGESSSHEQMLEEEESESAEPDDPSTTGASQTHTHGNTGGREHNTELEIPSSPEVCPTVRSVEPGANTGDTNLITSLYSSVRIYINHEHNHCQREVGNALTQPPVQRPTLRSIDLFLSGAAAPTHTICRRNQQQLGSHS